MKLVPLSDMAENYTKIHKCYCSFYHPINKSPLKVFSHSKTDNEVTSPECSLYSSQLQLLRLSYCTLMYIFMSNSLLLKI